MQSERQTRRDETRDATNDESNVYARGTETGEGEGHGVRETRCASGEWRERGRGRSETRRGGRE